MAETILRGPSVNAGSLLDNTVSPLDGPDIDYQAGCLPDVRFGPMRKDGTAPARVPAFLNSPYIVMSDNVPMIASTTVLAASQSAQVTGSALVLTTTAVGGSAAGVPSIAAGIPIVPLGTNVVTTVTALDFGFTTGTTAAASSTVVVVDSTLLQVGQWLVIGGAAASNVAGFVTQVRSITNATTITVLPAPIAALSHAPIAAANLFGSNLLPSGGQISGPPAAVANAASPYVTGGLAAVFDPLQTLARNVCIQGNTTNATAAFLVTGFDVYGAFMTELVTASGTTAVYGKKAFKYLLAATVNATSVTGTYTMGIGDTFGMHIRADKWEFTNLFWNGSFATNNNGFSSAVATTVATNTTGDVRGTIQLSLRGALATSFNSVNATTNGTGRLTLMMSVPLWNVINATPINSVPMFGLAQSST